MILVSNYVRNACFICIIYASALANAYSASVTVNFDAEIYQIDDPSNIIGNELGLTLSIEDIISASYTMDLNPTYTFEGGGGDSSEYTVNSTSIYADFGEAQYSTSSIDTYMGIYNDLSDGSGGSYDSWRIAEYLIEPPAPGTDLLFGIVLFDGSHSRLTDSDFFVNQSLDGWDNAVFYIHVNGGSTAALYAELVTVPIPAAAWLFGSGMLGLIGVSRRKKAA